MKKKFIAPKMETLEMQAEQLLAGSDGMGQGDPTQPGGRPGEGQAKIAWDIPDFM